MLVALQATLRREAERPAKRSATNIGAAALHIRLVDDHQ
jgi:hypothetical protein